MEYVVTGCYLLLLVWFVVKLPFFSDEYINKPVIVAAFLCKAVCGWVFIWLNSIYYYNGGDAVNYFKVGRLVFDTLHTNPLYFLELTFAPNNRIPPEYLTEIVETIPSWSDVRSYTAIRFNALAHLISFHSYPVHALFGTFLSFIGLTALYKTFAAYFPHRAKWLFAFFFFMPSILFWTSGLHKEGISLMLMGLMVWNSWLVIERKVTVKRALALLVNGFLLLLIRPYTLGLLLPVLVLWAMVKHFQPKWPAAVYTFAYLLGFAGLAVLSMVSEKLNVFAKLAEVRYYFVIYKLGGSDINLPLLEPTWTAFTKELPQALVNALLRPEPWGNIDPMQIIASVETLCLSLFVLFCLVFNNLRQQPHRYFLYACFFFAFTSLLLIGLTTDNLGAIVRYRSILLPFWLGFWIAIVSLPPRLNNTIQRLTTVKKI